MDALPAEARNGARSHATIFGAAGFVGGALAERLIADGWHVDAVRGREWPTGPLGHVFFCAGVTSDFRTRRFDTMDAHVSLAARVLREGELLSFVYLSSTRVYKDAASGAEDATLLVNPTDATDIFSASKLAGEALCLSDSRAEVKVARLSNVFGAADRSDNFLTSVMRDALAKGHVDIGLCAQQAKDYVAIEDVVTALARFPERARSRVINVASGVPVANGQIGARLSDLTGATFTFGDNPGPLFPPIEVARMRAELGVVPQQLEDKLAPLVAALRDTPARAL